MAAHKRSFGTAGEELAAGWLKAHGYTILARNYATKLGEIDIIAREKETICFIEVKSRSSGERGAGLEAVTPFKQRQICRVALQYLKEQKLLDERARFDAVAVSYSDGVPEVTVIKDAFELDQRYSY